MKILLLLILVSCGQYQKNEEVQDQKKLENFISDSSFKKFDFEVSGVLSLSSKNVKSPRIDIPFSNFFRPNNLALKILTKNKENFKNNPIDPFSQNIIFEFEPKEYGRLINDDYEATFFFKNGNNFTFSHFKNDSTQEYHLKNKNFFSLEMSKEEIIDILKGKNKIQAVSKNQIAFEDWNYYLKEYHYPILISDENKNEIIFVKNELKFEDYQKRLGIKNIINIEELSIFSPEINSDNYYWFTRNSPSNLKVLVRSKMKTISDFYKNSLLEQSVTLKREMGVSFNSLSFKKDKNAFFYVKIDGKKIFHKIPFLKHTLHKSGTHLFQICEQVINEIQNTHQSKLTFNEIINNLEIISEEGALDLRQAIYIKENITDEEHNWILAFNQKISNISLRIKPGNSRGLEVFSIKKRVCLGKNKNSFQSFEFENQLDLSASVFVEIIEE